MKNHCRTQSNTGDDQASTDNVSTELHAQRARGAGYREDINIRTENKSITHFWRILVCLKEWSGSSGGGCRGGGWGGGVGVSLEH